MGKLSCTPASTTRLCAVRHEDMFGSHENQQVGSDGWCAYMLFYCCTIPPQTPKDLLISTRILEDVLTFVWFCT